MAIYSYSCSNCSITQDMVRGISEPEPKYECEVCGSVMLRIYNVPGVTFNGSGFYSTDK
jgi:putative FmdB family regulatory protein